MQILELKNKNTNIDWTEITRRNVSEQILSIMKTHIGKHKPISRKQLFFQIYGVSEDTVKELNKYIMNEIIFSSITLLRKKSNCFIVSCLNNQTWVYYVPKNQKELEPYIKRSNHHISMLKYLQYRGERSIKENWHLQSWAIQ